MDLTIQHKDYTDAKALRTKAMHLWQGAAVVKKNDKTYLPKDEFESTKHYERRKFLGTYVNYPAKVVSAHMALLYRKAPERKLPEALNQYTDNIDSMGNAIHIFMHSIAQESRAGGLSFVLVDSTHAPVDEEGNTVDVKAMSAAQQKQANIRPYLRHVKADDLIDWSFDEDGKLSYIVIRIMSVTRKENEYGASFGMECIETEQYQVWDRNHWWLFERDSVSGAPSNAKWILKDNGTHPVGEVPITAFYGIKTGEMCGEPITKDILDHVLTIYNMNASRYCFEDLKCNPLPYVFSSEKPDFVQIANDGGLWLLKDAINTPQAGYMEPTGEGSSAIENTVTQLEEQIYAIALEEAKLNTKQVESAETQRENRMVFSASIDVAAQLLEESEERCFRHMAKWVNANPDEVTVSYNRDFDEKVIDATFMTILFDAASKGKFPLRQLYRILIDGEVLGVPEKYKDNVEGFIDWLITENDRDSDKAILPLFERMTANTEPQSVNGQPEPQSGIADGGE